MIAAPLDMIWFGQGLFFIGGVAGSGNEMMQAIVDAAHALGEREGAMNAVV